jgi:deazaflavin-dependent oxidoreductase (nitroreductase family)
MRYITWFDEIGRDDIATVGGKGANLGELTRAGVPVPPGFVVDTDAYNAFVNFNDLRDDIIALASRPGADDPAAYETAAAEIRRLFEQGDIPEDLADEIRRAYEQLAESNGHAVAVRSSATAEDLPTASFAGQQETFLNIHGDEALLDAVKKCWASLWTARAMAYRARQEIDPADVSLAVVVQQMVPADASGILFTANPVSGRRDQAVINAAWGLGEAIVGGQVTPDTLTVDKDTGEVVERETADKEVMVVRVDGGTETQPVPDDRRTTPVLDDNAAARLVRYGVEVEELYGAPQDIEWTLVNGDFDIVQTRSITALPEPEAPPPTEWPLPGDGGQYMRGSMADFMPDPLSPLFQTLALPMINASLNELIRDLTSSRMSLEDGLVVTVNDYAYVGMNLAGRDWVVLGIGMVPKMPNLMRTAVDRMREARRQYAEVVEHWEEKSLNVLRAEEILAGVREILGVAFKYTTTLQSGTMGAAGGSEGLFTAVYDKLIKREDGPPAPTFLLGFDSTPIQAEKELYDLAMWSREHPGLVDHLQATLPRELADQLASGGVPADIDADVWPEWQQRFQGYLDTYGHSIYDLDFAKPVPADDPTPILQTLKMFVAGQGTNPHERQRHLADRRQEAVEAVERRLDPMRLKMFRTLLDWAQRLAPLREDGIADIGLGWPRLREMLLELGRRLAGADAIEQAGDIFWLRRAEVETAAAALDQGESPADYRDEIRERQAVWRAEKRVTPPPQLPPKAKWLGIDMARWLPAEADTQAGDALTGVAASPGQVTAPACVLHGPEDFDRMQPDHVLVAGITTPAWTPLFAMAAGIVTDVGGPLSHGSIVAREYGIPAVLGTGVATQRIQGGQVITVDGSAGVVRLTDEGPGDDQGLRGDAGEGQTSITATNQTTWRRIQGRIRQFNKRILNPFTLSFAGRRYSPYAIVRHVGRRSGRVYHTPVWAEAMDGSFVIPLPYGDHVDWYRNVLAAGECILAWRGKAFRAGEPKVIDEAVGLRAIPEPVRNLIRHSARRTGNDQLLQLKRLSEEGDAVYQRITVEHPIYKPLLLVGAASLLVFAARALSRRD